MDTKYIFSFIAYVLSFSFVALRFTEQGVDSIGVLFFAIFIGFSVLALLTMHWFLLAVSFAFLLSYLISMFLATQTTVLFLLIVLNVIGFMLAVFPSCRRKPVDLNHEKKQTEQEFNRIQQKNVGFDEAIRKVATKKVTKKRVKKVSKKKTAKRSKTTKTKKKR